MVDSEPLPTSPNHTSSANHHSQIRWDRNDPRHPFARASFIPKHPLPEIIISAGSDQPCKLKEPSAFRSFLGLFRSGGDTNPVPDGDVEVTVTTEIEIESIHEEIYEEDDIEMNDAASERSRAHSL
jgi:hypothetical protein